jgi:hypothetical protein
MRDQSLLWHHRRVSRKTVLRTISLVLLMVAGMLMVIACRSFLALKARGEERVASGAPVEAQIVALRHRGIWPLGGAATW